MSEYRKHRDFIHDISNELAINEGAVKRIQKLLPADSSSNEIQELLEMSINHSKTCITKLKEYRTFIIELENKAKTAP